MASRTRARTRRGSLKRNDRLSDTRKLASKAEAGIASDKRVICERCGVKSFRLWRSGSLCGRAGVKMGGDCVADRTLWQGVPDDPKQDECPERHEERRL